ncbi:MAG: NAD+ synthase [Planctomycetota bacterium]|nr:NAD+ synthase [Planctomycetota bacterium]MDA1211692.1 NAD+ synthase [Planctomycetota bacterium]
MKIALIQLNPIIGDLRGNRELIRHAVVRAGQAGADLCVTSELAISGYPPKDLLLREGFVATCDRIVDELATDFPNDLGVIIGHPTTRGVPAGRIANGASLIADGRVQTTVQKFLLPNYDVFDEQRYFRPAERVQPVTYRGLRIGLHICEDAWWGEPSTFYHSQPVQQNDPVAELARQGVDLFVNISASPFEIDKPHRRTGIAARHAKRHKLPFVFVNQVGGNDDLVFDGHSMVLDANGEKVLSLAGFKADQALIDLDALPAPVAAENTPREEFLLQALTLGLRDYMQKCGFSECVLGLSGGIDSALAAYLATRAAGPKHVHGLLMPSRYSSEHSVADARQLAENLGIDWKIIPIDEIHKSYETTDVIRDDLASQPGGLADQNLQARIRGAMVMLRSNRYGWLPLATGNKSELAVGYCTIYGDMAGGFAVLSDLFKREVYALSKYINEHVEKREVIPQMTINKAPSAELAPDQFDQDSLPPYSVLDAILEGLIEREWSVEKLCTLYPAETVKWVIGKLDRNEFKRRQMPPGIKLSPRAFGTGRRMPMAARFEV